MLWRKRLASLLAVACLVLGVSLDSLEGQEIFGVRLRPSRPYDNVTALAFTRDSQQLFVGSAMGKISIVDVPSGRTVKSFGGPDFLSRVVMSPKGNMLAGIRGGFEDILLWNAKDWTPLPILRTPNRSDGGAMLRPPQRVDAYSIALSPDGSVLAVGCADHSILLWDMASQTISHVVYGHLDAVDSLSFSPDNRLLASASRGEIRGSPVVLWDVRTGHRVKVIIAHPESTTCMVFLPGGTQLASSGIDGAMDDVTIRIWDIASGRNVQTLTGHTNSVRAIVAIPHGKLITGGQDCTIRLWDLATLRELRQVSTGRHSVQTLALSPDGKYLACGLISSEGRYELWKLSEVFPEAVGIPAEFGGHNAKY